MLVRSFTLALMLVAINFTKVDAGVVITFSPAVQQVTIPLSGTTQIPITVRIAANAGTQEIAGYEIPVDVRPPIGSGLPSGWTIGSGTPIFTFPGSFGFFQSELTPAEGDLRVGDLTLGDSVTLTVDPIDLFTFDLTVSSNAVPGQVSVGIFDGVLLSVANVDRGDINFQSLGIINAVAVPEPFVTPLLAIAGLALLRRRFRR
jgi:hypothetical protein